MRHTEYAQVSSGANSPPKPRPKRQPPTNRQYWSRAVGASQHLTRTHSLLCMQPPAYSRPAAATQRPAAPNKLTPACCNAARMEQAARSSSSLCPPDGQRTDTCVSARVCCCLTIDVEPSGQDGDKSSALAGQGTCSTLHDTPAGRPVVCWWSNAVHQNTRRVYVVLEMAKGPAPLTAGERADRRPKPPAKPDSI